MSIFWGYWILCWREILFIDETNVPENLKNGIKAFSKIQFKECEQNSDLKQVESAYWDKTYTYYKYSKDNISQKLLTLSCIPDVSIR